MWLSILVIYMYHIFERPNITCLAVLFIPDSTQPVVIFSLLIHIQYSSQARAAQSQPDILTYQVRSWAEPECTQSEPITVSNSSKGSARSLIPDQTAPQSESLVGTSQRLLRRAVADRDGDRRYSRQIPPNL